MSSDVYSSPQPNLSSGPSYRPKRRARGWSTGPSRLWLIGAAALLTASAAAWELTGSRGASVPPVIEADLRPVRMKPENAGGMQVAGADEQVAGDPRRNGMAPAPEAPAPQALRAQLGAGKAPPVEITPASTPGLPSPDITAPVPVATSAAPPPHIAPASSGAAPSGPVVQLAAVGTEQAAHQEWQRLSKRLPDLLGGRVPAVQRVERDGRTVWRLRTGGFADTAEATGFCARVRAQGSGCTIGSF